MAASLMRFLSSAPTMPGVDDATTSRSTSSASGTLRVWTSRMAFRPVASGGLITRRRSKRPGRSNAESRISGRLVAPRTMTPSAPVNPSISVRIWLRVCSRSSWPPMLLEPPRARPMASSSSMKMMAGAAALACTKRSRTRLAPTPTIISMNSEADTEKNGTSASPASARARRVLPVPGGPDSSTPLGMLAPRRRYRSGFLRKSTISATSSSTSSMPATSSKLTRLPSSGS